MPSSGVLVARDQLHRGNGDNMSIRARQELAVRRVIKALEDEGANPGYHRAQLSRIADECPSLARALSELMASHEHRPPRELLSGFGSRFTTRSRRVS